MFLIETRAQDARKEKAAMHQQAIQKIMDEKHFIFQAQSASPIRGGTRQLSPGYSIALRGDTINCELPYYGRSYTATINPSDAGIKFISTDFEYEVKERKKGGSEITIAPRDVRNSVKIYLSISSSGNTTARVTSSDRQPISFNGFLEELDDE
jgi:hypothetical protein